MAQKLNSKYIEQVQTLIEVLPYISQNKNFALKGGTAINLFLLDMPRLSVDIDLCYLPLIPRDQALSEISAFTRQLLTKLTSIGYRCREKNAVQGYESTIFVQSQNTEIKVEINLVVRGSVYQPILKPLCPIAVDTFKREAEILCLDTYDLFGGKICAALDRQHPRDFFDIHMFFKEFTYTRELHQAFMVYLLSSKRPISELIKPNYINIESTYERQFEGMTSQEITCADLEETREKLFNVTASFFSEEDKDFLISFKKGEPKWDLFPLSVVKDFPSVQWKLHNIRSMTSAKKKESLAKLEKKLYT